MISICNAKEYSNGIKKAIEFIHGAWGHENNYPFYEDAIENSSTTGKALPEFYLLLKDDEIIGCAALITMDFISRGDLYPWMACLYINKTERGNSYGNLLMKHAEERAMEIGFSKIYLTTGHDGYYEKYGWTRIEDGIDLFSCKPSRIYMKTL